MIKEYIWQYKNQTILALRTILIRTLRITFKLTFNFPIHSVQLINAIA